MDPVRDESLELAYDSGTDILKSQDTTLGNPGPGRAAC